MSDDAVEVRVELGERSYSVWIGQGLLSSLADRLPAGRWRNLAVLTDSNVGPLYAGHVLEALRAVAPDTVLLEIQAGEVSKSIQRALEVVDWLMASGITRTDLMLALGGGVVGDLAGFTASVYKRGMPLIHVPTTLMAQVDSAIGGKTAVNLPEAKNQLGTFQQPAVVICDISLLASLPLREFRSGLGEMAKYCMISDRQWARDVRSDPGSVSTATPERLAGLVAESVREKAVLVSEDERDAGVRHYLNYGHTLAHALEAASGYDGTYSHGEAVSIGMMYASLVSESSGLGKPGLAGRHEAMLSEMGLPVKPFGDPPPFSALSLYMAQDKKIADGGFVLVLLEAEGRPEIVRGLDPALLEECYRRMCEGARGAA